MTLSEPAGPQLGAERDGLDTPALLLDLDRFERNSARLAGAIHQGGVAWRPHSKAHKSPVLAARQIELGAIGVTCAKVGEAEVMVAHGIGSVLVANELGSRPKLDRIARLQDRAEVIVCADDPYHVELAAAAALAAGVEIPMLVEVDIGMHRAGVAPGAAARDLARLIDRSRGVRFAGLMGYEGQVLTLWPADVKDAAAREAIGRLVDTRRLVERDGIAVGIVSGGGSGSYTATARIDGMTEIQAGGACLMDLFYADECHLAEEGYEFALTVLAMVTSRPTRDRAIIDAGFKTMSARDGVPPRPVGVSDVTVTTLSAEHGYLELGPGAPDLKIGQRVELIPDYSDTTTFRHDQFVGLRAGRVERVIPLLARGRLS
jgi:D-serine deaminase-like pyridoxal phosphate-dependent protein